MADTFRRSISNEANRPRELLMKLYSYVVARDYGFAPNPFFGICTLATCKPIIRKMARIGDWIIGTGSKAYSMEKNIVFAMCVSREMTFDQYYIDPNFQVKKPYLRGSKKQAFGDNIYSKNLRTNKWHQDNSHHSLPNGSPNIVNIRTDTQTDRILLSTDFIYWGGNGPLIPKKFLQYGPEKINICAGRGQKCNFPKEMVSEMIIWIRSLHQTGCIGEPLKWSK
jgi:hypothetical protein